MSREYVGINSDRKQGTLVQKLLCLASPKGHQTCRVMRIRGEASHNLCTFCGQGLLLAYGLRICPLFSTRASSTTSMCPLNSEPFNAFFARSASDG